MNKKLYIMLFAAMVAMVSCREVPTYDVTQPKGDTLKERMIGANRIISQSEEQQIDSYVARRGWQMQRLADGARVMVTRQGQGAAIGYEDTVDILYRVENLAGKVIYDSVQEQVVAGHLKPTRGLDAAIRTLRRGAEAKVILPSEQAYGVVGDTEKIGSRVVLIYTVEVH